MDETGPIADAITACVVETMNTSTEEVVESASFYMSTTETVWVTLLALFTCFIIFRLGKLFVEYIKTGKLGDFEDDCFVYNIFEGHPKDIPRALAFGTFPIAILVDMLGFLVMTFVIGFLWPVIAILLPLISLAYLIRLPIARKQEFVGRLDGSYEDPDCHNGGS